MSFPKDYRTLRFLGIEFWDDSLPKLFQKLWDSPGMVVVPAAPNLADMPEDPYYRTAVRSSDYAIIDSMAMTLAVAVTRLRIVHRISGLKFLQYFLLQPDVSQIADKHLLWIVPTEAEKERLEIYLDSLTQKPIENTYYLAPIYTGPESYLDEKLFNQIQSKVPDCVVVCIGGGKQEKLAFEIRNRFDRRFSIICIGAAIAFLTGGQTHIPTWADRAGLGWLCRILEDPVTYGKRYWKAFYKLPGSIIRGGG